MNSKFLVLTGCLLFTFGCSHSSMDVAKTDIPEDDIIASEPVMLRPVSKMAKMDEEDVGYSDFNQNKVVKRGIASEDGSETVAGGGNSNPEENERTVHDEFSSSSSSRATRRCNTLAYAKMQLGVPASTHTGNAGQSMNAWLAMPGYAKITASEAKKSKDFCVFSGGSTGVGTIIMREGKGWGDGCRKYDSLPHPIGYHLIGCVRPPKSN